jgi:hypothetical protein
MRDELALLRDARPDATGPAPELARATRSTLMSEIAVHSRRRPKLRRRRIVLLAAASAAVAAAALVSATVSWRNGGTAFAAALVRVAQAAPRMLIVEPGWKVTRADEFGVGYGEMTFANGDRKLDLQWDRGIDLGSKLGEPGSGLQPLGTMTVQGASAKLWRYVGSNDFVATWLHGGYGLEARGLASDAAAFRLLVGTLQEVGVNKWLSAMPQSVVKPDGRSKIALAMLDGVPLPPHFDVGSLLQAEGGTVLDRYQLGAKVTGAVGCAWLERWVAARRAGDTAAVRQAVGALATSHHWRVLQQMQAEGAWPRVFWEYADAAAADAPVMGGKPLPVEESYRDALGCGQQ